MTYVSGIVQEKPRHLVTGGHRVERFSTGWGGGSRPVCLLKLGVALQTGDQFVPIASTWWALKFLIPTRTAR